MLSQIQINYRSKRYDSTCDVISRALWQTLLYIGLGCIDIAGHRSFAMWILGYVLIVKKKIFFYSNKLFVISREVKEIGIKNGCRAFGREKDRNKSN